MNKSMKMKVLFLFVIMFFSVLYIKPINGEAYTSKGINKEIKKVSRQIKVLTKKYNCLLYTSDAADEHRDV